MNDAIYQGTVYLGSPESQPAKLIFDTGSEYLIVTSVLCSDSTAAEYKFKKLDPVTGDLQLKSVDKDSRCQTMAYNMTASKS